MTEESYIPIIDISPLVINGPVEQRKQIGIQLDRACREVGFFYVKGHGIDPQYLESLFQIAKEFFDLPQEEKNQISINKVNFPRGYQKLGENVTQYQTDWHEAIDIYKEVRFLEEEKGTKPFLHPNPWPARPAQFKEMFENYVELMKKIGGELMRALALGLNFEENYFIDNFTSDSFWVCRIIGYPPISTASGVKGVSYSCGEHTDYGWLTIVNQDSTRGALQVKTKKGDWIDANPIPGAFVMNIGDMFKLWSNGTYSSTPHRVINKAERYRVSIPFFYEPNFEGEIAPHPMFGEPKFKPISYGEFLMSKVNTNFQSSFV
eukprot:TRINITY_DN4913_c0_g1_i1.p1 TRINITY_DN4913_c0_g1~~TRINITY_DN4913_c0_g1_i1.p1  ORF type:complete len:320 (-),score=67.16 TRINITY_DN4913_c0_g1_i1:36-995(-)